MKLVTFYLASEIAVTDYLEPNNEEEVEEEIQEQEETKEKKGKRYVATYIVFSQFVFEVIILIGGAVWLGVYLDKLLNTKVLFLLLFIFLAGPVPFYNLIRRTRR